MKLHWKIYKVIEPDCYKRYPSYKHYIKVGQIKNPDRSNFYFTEKPREAGNIGHTMNNWIAGYVFAGKFHCKYAYYPFQDTYVPYIVNKWDKVLGFDYREVKVQDLLKKGFKKIQLPKFDENNAEEVNRIQKIIDAYSGKKVVFFAEQDQFLKNQYEASEAIKEKYLKCESRKNDRLIYDPNCISVAVHIRRTVVADTGIKNEDAAARALRWTGVEYFQRIMEQVDQCLGQNLSGDTKIKFYIFTTGDKEEFHGLIDAVKSEVIFCNTLDEYTSFTNMVKADILVTSKSSFSYNPALLSSGIKIVPSDFWHGYPDDEKWITADSKGEISNNNLAFIKSFVDNRYRGVKC